MVLVLFFLIILLAVIYVPQYAIIVVFLNFFVGFLLSVFQIRISLLPYFKIKRRKSENQPFVSILVPAHNEPPIILMQTLETLSGLDYENFEVLVIDNNTLDQKIWKPVELFVRTLGRKFRFFHVENLSGFKAGALNYVLKHVDSRSRYVVVIDADYIVKKNFLKSAIPYFGQKKLALVQFPQRYRNCNFTNMAIADEYRHFFRIYMNMANHLNCVSSTGTVSVYNLEALKKVGGFRGQALTEDADIGLRIYGAGYRSLYIDESIGYGLMPHDLDAYRKQKWRWAFGNAQSVKTLFSLSGKIPFKSWLGFFSQLTAWDHFNFIPYAVLAAYVFLLLPFFSVTQAHFLLLQIACLSILATIVSKFFLFYILLKGKKKSISRALKAFVVHMGMTLVYSQAWLAFIFQEKYSFERTNKFILTKVPSLLKNSYGELILGILFLIGSLEAALWGRKLSVIAFLAAYFSLFSIYYIYWKIILTEKKSKKIFLQLEKKYKDFI